jgi:hypothetical protein
MNSVLIDSCVLLDLFTADHCWSDWSERILSEYSQNNTLLINSIIYTEISIGFQYQEEVDEAITQMGIVVAEIPREALFLAGKTFLSYRRNKGTKYAPLPDFFIGSHASVAKLKLITRDAAKFKTYFPQIDLILPNELEKRK